MNKIQYWREQAKLTQAQLSSLCGWQGKQSRISNYESGLRTPDVNDCRVIVAALNKSGASCTLDDVFPPIQQAS